MADLDQVEINIFKRYSFHSYIIKSLNGIEKLKEESETKYEGVYRS
ncbi:hypothetical protein J6Y73_01775 [bacterium]|nr:hypothetical protein [bacterium]